MNRRSAVHHLAVAVDDLEAALAFYHELLGLPVIQRWSHPDGSTRAIWLSLGDGSVDDPFLALEKSTPGPRGKATHGGFLCVALRIESTDRERFRHSLAEAGFPVESESEFTLYVRDPEGNLIGLSHFPVAASV